MGFGVDWCTREASELSSSCVFTIQIVRVSCSWTLVSLNLRPKDLLGPVTRVKKKKKKSLLCRVSESDRVCEGVCDLEIEGETGSVCVCV